MNAFFAAIIHNYEEIKRTLKILTKNKTNKQPVQYGSSFVSFGTIKQWGSVSLSRDT